MSPLPGMKIPWGVELCFFALLLSSPVCRAQDDYNDYNTPAAAPPPPELETCNGIYVSYTFESRDKTYPLLKNATAQPWAFKSQLSVMNAGAEELKSWKVHLGFQYNELLVATEGAIVVDAEDFPVKVGKNGTVLAGYPTTDLKTAIDTASDFGQMTATVNIAGTMFGLKTGTPMPKSMKLMNEGYKCPASKKSTSKMWMCCKKDPKLKKKPTKANSRKYGDLTFTYDILQSFAGNYLAQVTIDNFHPLGRLDHWNLTWEWMRGEFIYSMRGALTNKQDPSECIYGTQGQYYKDFDFSPVLSCARKPVISDLPPEKENSDKFGKIPYCCRNGSLLPQTMNETKSRAIFQLQVYKMPPDLNRTALYPPQNWKIRGVLNPTYKCGPPIRVDASEFPDPLGLAARTTAVATWQVTCNITRPKPKQAQCCVSYSAFFANGVVPCPTCACGCENENNKKCDKNAKALSVPTSALLVPFENRTEKAIAFAKLNKEKLPSKLPCPDNCGVTINWHLESDYKGGWTARMTLFNWEDYPFADWFAAIQMGEAFQGYEKVYSFNGTVLDKPNNTIFFQGIKGLNYLVGEVNGSKPSEPRVPGKQQSVISFSKKHTRNINVIGGGGYPKKVFFNGEECALPKEFPKPNGGHKFNSNFIWAAFVAILTYVLIPGLEHW